MHQALESDEAFDAVFAPQVRRLSRLQWTPLAVVRTAMGALGLQNGMSVLDVGSGAGKFCLAGALLTQAEFVGVECQTPLVVAAREAAIRLDASRARFIEGDALEVDWSGYDVVYLYNPFEGGLFETDEAAVRTQFNQSAYRAKEKLARLKAGARLVLFRGFGTELPEGFRPIFTQAFGPDTLCVWEKMGSVPSEG